MITWLANEKGPVKIKDSYKPSFYIHATPSDLQHVHAMLKQLPNIHQTQYSNAKITLGSDIKRLTLKVTPEKLIDFHKIANMVDTWGKHHKYHLYNVDIRMPTRYLHNRNVFFNAYVTWNGKLFKLNDEQWTVDYQAPRFSSSTLKIKREQRKKVPSIHDTLSKTFVDDVEIHEENEIDTILKTIKIIQSKNPDILYTYNGDGTMFPFLIKQALKHKILNKLIIGRDKQRPLRQTKQSTSYFSYGRIIHRAAFYTLFGRAHIDLVNSFFHGEGGTPGLIDISRCANIPFQLLSRLGPGTAISQMQVNTAKTQGYLIPWKKTRPETWKTATDLLNSDRGGLILDPVVGVHDDVIELDYASLYPNIMLSHNISPETLLCTCCPDSSKHVPQLGYHICEKKRGLLPTVLKPILQRRFLFKARSKNKAYDTQRYQQLQQAWKWVLLVCFGYTGYKNARYGRIECHESITAYSRDILLLAMHTAEKANYEILHGIIDSLWVKQKKPGVTPLKLARKISKETGIKVDVEATYKWIVFLPNKQAKEIGALNRYYGMFKNGEIKTRGIEQRQQSTPPFFKKTQIDVIKQLCKAENTQEFKEIIPKAMDVTFNAACMLIDKKVKPSDLVFITRVTKNPLEYKVNNVVKSALLQLQKLDIHLKPGQSIQYLIKNEKSREPNKRVCIMDLITKNTEYDTGFYLRYLARCTESLLNPFGYTQENIEEILNKIRSKKVQSI
jgi:DNA polymerase elongation subunit (family B)